MNAFNSPTALLPIMTPARYPEIPASQDDSIPADALELLVQLWHRALNGTVTLQPGEWLQLQRILLAVYDRWKGIG